MKKLLVMLLAAAMCVSMLAGCSGSGSGDSAAQPSGEASQQESQAAQNTEKTEESTAPAEQTSGLRDLTALGDEHMASYFLMANTMEEFTAWQALRKMMEAKNINIVAEFVADDQYQSMLQTRFASMNNVPMFCYNNLSDNEVMALADNGQILDFLPLIEGGDGTAKNFFEVNPFGSAALAKVALDGKIWWLPNLYVTTWNGTQGEHGTNVGLNIRHDWLEKYGLDYPKTLDEYHDALKTFNEQDPSGSGANTPGMNVYSYSLVGGNDAQAMLFGLVRGLINVNWDTDVATSMWKQDTMKDYIAWVQGMVKEGLIDETMIGSNTELRSKAANNQIGAYTTYPNATGYEPLIEAAKDENGQITACYAEIIPFAAVEGVTPLLAIEDPIYMWDHFVFTSVLTDAQLGADFLDVYYSDASIDLINWGVEGINYEVVNGEKQFLKGKSTVEGVDLEFDLDQQNKFIQEKADLRASYGKHLYSRALFPDMTYYNLDADIDQLINGTEPWAKPKGEACYETINNWEHYCSIDVSGCLAAATSEESALYNQYYSDLSTASQEAIMSLATSETPVDDIPTIVENLDNLGLSQIIDQYQARHDRFIGK
jgi:putative aldouronate transport system substrate-binding protein